VAYYRKSTDEQEQSIDRQRAQVERYAAARGYRLLREYTDEGIAGDIFDRRPDFQQMLQAAQHREFEVIVVDEPSRLSRQNPIELIATTTSRCKLLWKFTATRDDSRRGGPGIGSGQQVSLHHCCPHPRPHPVEFCD